jgi:hypothetical protein
MREATESSPSGVPTSNGEAGGEDDGEFVLAKPQFADLAELRRAAIAATPKVGSSVPRPTARVAWEHALRRVVLVPVSVAVTVPAPAPVPTLSVRVPLLIFALLIFAPSKSRLTHLCPVQVPTSPQAGRATAPPFARWPVCVLTGCSAGRSHASPCPCAWSLAYRKTRCGSVR